jgi:hypothetical protein
MAKTGESSAAGAVVSAFGFGVAVFLAAAFAKDWKMLPDAPRGAPAEDVDFFSVPADEDGTLVFDSFESDLTAEVSTDLPSLALGVGAFACTGAEATGPRPWRLLFLALVFEMVPYVLGPSTGSMSRTDSPSCPWALERS